MLLRDSFGKKKKKKNRINGEIKHQMSVNII